MADRDYTIRQLKELDQLRLGRDFELKKIIQKRIQEKNDIDNKIKATY